MFRKRKNKISLGLDKPLPSIKEIPANVKFYLTQICTNLQEATRSLVPGYMFLRVLN